MTHLNLKVLYITRWLFNRNTLTSGINKIRNVEAGHQQPFSAVCCVLWPWQSIMSFFCTSGEEQELVCVFAS